MDDQPGSPAPVIGFVEHPFWRSKIFIYVLGLELIAGIAIADYITGFEFDLSMLYLAAVCFIGWRLGRTSGIVFAVLAVATWFVNDRLTGHVFPHAFLLYPHSFLHLWKGLVLLATWIIFVIVLDKLKVALAHADERFATVLEGLDQAVYVVDQESGELLYLNQRCQDLFGTEEPLTNSRQIEAQLQPPPPAPAEERGREFFDAARQRWYLLRASTLRWVDGRTVLLKVATDITERKQAEELNRQQREKLQLTSRLVTVGEMASTLAHEINQPLTAIANYIMGCVRRLRAGNRSPQEILTALEKAGAQAERAGRIIQRVRELVRKREPQRAAIDINSMIANAVSLMEINAEENNVQLERAPELPAAYADEVMPEQAILNLTRNGTESVQQAPPVQRMRELVRKRESQRTARDINSVIANAVSLIEIDAEKNNVQLKLELAPELPAVYADDVMLEQAILNLARNGIESMQQAVRDERELTIRSRLNQGGAIEIEIADTGCGLPEAIVRNPFEPFFTTKPDGLGMGLSICRAIVEWHNGRLWATRNPGRGSTFHLTLPIRQT